MTPNLRKFALTAHVTSSVGLLGAIAGFTSPDTQMVRAAYLAMELIARYVIVPLAFVSLLTGLIQSLGTPWGLFRHYWVLAKFLLTAIATTILLIKLDLISYAARLAAETILSRPELRAAGAELLVHSAAGLVVLLVPAILSIYKPRGLTPYGRRKQLEQRTPSQPNSPLQSPNLGSNDNIVAWPGGGSNAGAQRRAYVLGFIAIVVILHVVILHLAGIGLGGH